MKPQNNRLLFNGDCTYLFNDRYITSNDGRYTCDALHHFIDLLAASGVDTYIQNANAQKPWYPSRALSPVWEGYTRGDREFVRGHYPPANNTHFPPEKLNTCLTGDVTLLDYYLDLLEDGVDWIEEIPKACRRNNIAPWISVRMNDMHGAANWEKSYMNCDLQKDPHYRLSGRSLDLCDAVNSSQQVLNYEHPEVRDYYFAMIRELVEEYDYEGLELDWLRSPFCCEPPATQHNLDMMTGWMAQIRALTNRQASKRNRAYALGLRIPVRLDVLKTIGLDVQTFARGGLIDFIAPSNSWQTTWDIPYEKLRIAVGNDVSIYGVVEDAPNWLACRSSSKVAEATACLDGFSPSHRCLSASAELLRGNAAGKLVQGADGIYLYNFFCTDEQAHNPTPEKTQAKYPALYGLHKLETLRGKTKHYALSTANDARMHYFFEFADQLPVTLAPGDQRTFTISMCSEPATENPERTQGLLLQLVIEKANENCQLVAIFNGCMAQGMATFTDRLLFPTGIFTHHAIKHEAYNFQFSASDIKEGWNELLVLNNNNSNVRILSLELAVLAELS